MSQHRTENKDSFLWLYCISVPLQNLAVYGWGRCCVSPTTELPPPLGHVQRYCVLIPTLAAGTQWLLLPRITLIFSRTLTIFSRGENPGVVNQQMLPTSSLRCVLTPLQVRNGLSLQVSVVWEYLFHWKSIVAKFNSSSQRLQRVVNLYITQQMCVQPQFALDPNPRIVHSPKHW